MRRPPTEHEEWLEENQPPKKRAAPAKSAEAPSSDDEPSGASKRFQALNDDIQEFG